MKIDPQLRQELKHYIQQKLNEERKKVQIISSYSLSEHEMNGVLAHFPFLKDAHIENTVDHNLIAGVVIKFGTKMIDLSLKTKLLNLKQSLYEIA